MLGLMQHYPLLISSLIVHAARHRGGGEVVSNLGDPSLHRTTYAEVERRSRRLARVLDELGVVVRIWSGKIPGNSGRLPVRSWRARNQSRIAACPWSGCKDCTSVPGADATGDPDHDEWIESEAIPVIHARIVRFLFWSVKGQTGGWPHRWRRALIVAGSPE